MRCLYCMNSIEFIHLYVKLGFALKHVLRGRANLFRNSFSVVVANLKLSGPIQLVYEFRVA